jgi:hypothetical protein
VIFLIFLDLISPTLLDETVLIIPPLEDVAFSLRRLLSFDLKILRKNVGESDEQDE